MPLPARLSALTSSGLGQKILPSGMFSSVSVGVWNFEWFMVASHGVLSGFLSNWWGLSPFCFLSLCFRTVSILVAWLIENRWVGWHWVPCKTLCLDSAKKQQHGKELSTPDYSGDFYLGLRYPLLQVLGKSDAVCWAWCYKCHCTNTQRTCSATFVLWLWNICGIQKSCRNISWNVPSSWGSLWLLEPGNNRSDKSFSNNVTRPER